MSHKVLWPQKGTGYLGQDCPEVEAGLELHLPHMAEDPFLHGRARIFFKCLADYLFHNQALGYREI